MSSYNIVQEVFRDSQDVGMDKTCLGMDKMCLGKDKMCLGCVKGIWKKIVDSVLTFQRFVYNISRLI